MYVEEEGNGYVHPSSGHSRQHVPPNVDFTRLLLSPVAPASENRVGDHIHEAGVDLQGLMEQLMTASRILLVGLS